jgi:hypothetical protein
MCSWWGVCYLTQNMTNSGLWWFSLSTYSYRIRCYTKFRIDLASLYLRIKISGYEKWNGHLCPIWEYCCDILFSYRPSKDSCEAFRAQQVGHLSRGEAKHDVAGRRSHYLNSIPYKKTIINVTDCYNEVQSDVKVSKDYTLLVSVSFFNL